MIYYSLAAISPWATPAAAILGALAATSLITFAALKTRSVVTLILIGVGLSSFADLGFAAPFLLLGFIIIMATRRGLNALTLGEEGGQGVGLDIRRQRIAVVLRTGLLSGAAVCIAGAIGFVGIIAPHVERPWVSYDPARTLLPAGLLAGIILVAADG